MQTPIPSAADIRAQYGEPDASNNELGQALAAADDSCERHRQAMRSLHRQAGSDALSASDQRRWDAHEREQSELDSLRAQYERAETETRAARAGRVSESRARYGTRMSSDDQPPTLGGGDLRSAALRIVDTAHRSGELPDGAAERVARLVDQPESQAERTLAARWAVTAGAPEYRTAFAKLLADPQRGHLLWTPGESEAYRAVAAVRTEFRAMSLNDNAGGYMVPLTLDPAILLTSAGSINPLRQISRVVQTVTDGWQGVTSAGATAEWKTESAEAADGSPSIAPAPIPVHFGDSFVPYSFEVGMDAVNFLNELQGVLLDAAAQLMATAYTTGTGAGQPKGVITALAGTASEINGSGTEVLTAADAFALQNALPARFQARAQWCAHLATINALAQMETANGSLKFPELRNGQLLRKPLNELSNMDGTTDAAVTGSNYSLVYGDFTNFVIVDRIGTTLEIVPHLTGPNGRPTGQRGALMWFRTGSDVVVPNAFRLLDVPTTAP